jgi:hypothetical protein
MKPGFEKAGLHVIPGLQVVSKPGLAPDGRGVFLKILPV